MLLRVDCQTKLSDRVRSVPLGTFGFDERGLQGILFASLDRLLGEDELLMLRQSRRWQEEPDLMAVDREGKLFIFEIKVGGAQSANLLQVLRYGQIFGNHKYEDLDRMWRSSHGPSDSLADAHAARFGLELKPEEFNRRQVFVVLTNGLDFRTREAIGYWKSCGLDVRPWIYRTYPYQGEPNTMLLEVQAFRNSDNPFEDIAEGYYIVNTNISSSSDDDADMITNKKVAAYFDPWKLKIERLNHGDWVFLYRSKVGIVAAGKVDGKLRKAPYHGQPQYADEEYNMQLLDFVAIEPAITAAEVKSVTGNNYVFMPTMFSLDGESGSKVLELARQRKR